MLANAATKAAQARAGEEYDEDTLRPEELTEKPLEKPAPSKHEAQSNKPMTRLRATATTGPAAQQQPALTGNKAKDPSQASLKPAASSWALNRPKLGSATSTAALNVQSEQQAKPAPPPPAGAAEKTVSTSDTNDGTDADRPKKKAAFRFTKLPRVALLACAPASKEPLPSGATTSGTAATSRPGTKETQRQLRGAAGPQQQAPPAAISKRVPPPGTAPPTSAFATHEGAQSTDGPAVQDNELNQVKELRAEVRSLREQLAAQKLSESEREMKLRTEMANQFQQVFKDQQVQNLYVRIPTEYFTIN